MATFGERLIFLRKEAGLSQEELAKIMKVSRSCIGNYEQGTRKPRDEEIEAFADFFNVDYAYMSGKSDIRNVYALELLPEDEKIILDIYRIDRNPLKTAQRLIGYAERMKDIEGRK